MPIHESRTNRRVAEIDDLRIARRRQIAPNIDNLVTLHDDDAVLHERRGTAKAHVLTATGLLQDGVTGGGKDAATFAAFVGASITLVAYNLKWHVLSANNVLVA